MEPRQDFLLQLIESLNTNQFVKLTLSKALTRAAELRNVYGKPVSIKAGERLSLTYRFATRDVVRNIAFEQVAEVVGTLLEKEFLIANLMTLKGDLELMSDKMGNSRLISKEASQHALPERQHDRVKKRLLDQQQPYWFHLGLTDRNGNVLHAMQHKWRQINQYIDILRHHLKPLLVQDKLKVIDMGAGKGYLTFALYEYLKSQQLNDIEVVGVEQRHELVLKTNHIAQKASLDGLRFDCGSINDYKLKHSDVLIALHACDTATDDAIAAGIGSGASLIVCAPCCHKQIRKEISASADTQPILKFGILMERQAEILTDALRALIMEKHGYDSEVQEFIEAGHTPKNLLLTGTRMHKAKRDETIDYKIKALKEQYGIKSHYLETLLTKR